MYFKCVYKDVEDMKGRTVSKTKDVDNPQCNAWYPEDFTDLRLNYLC